MSTSLIRNETFYIKRLSIEEAREIQTSYYYFKMRTMIRSYNIINDAKRFEIIEEVIKNKRAMRQVASRYKIKYSTIQNIIRVYLTEGRAIKKKERNKRKPKINTSKNKEFPIVQKNFTNII